MNYIFQNNIKEAFASFAFKFLIYPYKSTMNKNYLKSSFLLSFSVLGLAVSAQNNFQQNKQSIYNEIINEVENKSQLEHLAFELLDEIGPRW